MHRMNESVSQRDRGLLFKRSLHRILCEELFDHLGNCLQLSSEKVSFPASQFLSGMSPPSVAWDVGMFLQKAAENSR